jgi:cell division protein FtsA
MVKKTEKSLVVGLDIGTSKIVAIVGELQSDDSVEVIGLGSHASRGLKRGVVVDMASTEQAIQRAVEEAELMAGCEIHSVFCGISGNHIRSQNSDGTVAIKDKEVSEGDVDRVLDAARAVPVAADQKVLHVLPQEYVLDNQDGIRQPIGMAGVRLEAHVHVVTAASRTRRTLGYAWST